ncbi:hypothetical protein [Neobacillus cucumis]|uniref:Uncharacterized protein n=1 Tax=Neobacillus cucumis TaxID=1740721 RepID=A0A2N5H769_9BACI|nr:hypothetical protein [Neobacillus cucumis]PLS01367.1 hypothetical protein CVD27_25710 [Neobacillus cucumis]
MSELKYLEPTELLEKIYATLCSEYEDAEHYKDEKDQSEIEVTKKRLTKKIFNEFVVDEEYFLTMDSDVFKERYHLYEDDFLRLIKQCSENRVEYETFVQIIDDLIASAKFRLHAFEQLTEEIQKLQEVDEQEESEEANVEADEVEDEE